MKIPKTNNDTKPGTTVQRFWNVITNDGEDSAEITMYGDVCESQPRDFWTGEKLEGQYITPEGFAEDLATIKGKSKITIKLNSCGGDLYTGIAIHNALKGLTGHKTVIVEGIAASAASVIACAGDDVQVYPGSLVMIHGVAGLFFDYMTLGDLKKAVKAFDADERAVAEIYKAKTGIEVETLRNMMTNETWMTGSQAIEKGFADTLLGSGNEPKMQMSADRRVMMVAGVRHDVHAFRNIPGNIPIFNETDAASVTAGNKNKTEVTNMTEKELREQYPDIVASIEKTAADNARTEATAAERARLKGIESIEAQIGDKSLVQNAKYGDTPCDAAQLALAAMQAQSKLGSAFLQKMEADSSASGADEVAGKPNGGNADDGDETAAVVANAVKAYQKTKGDRKSTRLNSSHM